ncbi:solute carrier family 35 member G2-like [Branchiostoma floridae x Branchiostoma belcheri]
MADTAGMEAPTPATPNAPSEEKTDGTKDTDGSAQQFDGMAESLKGSTKDWSKLKTAEGIMAAMFSGVLITVASIYTRLAGDEGMPAIHSIFMNELMAAIVFLPMPFLVGAPITGNTWTTVVMLFILGIGRIIAFICFFISVLYIPPANSFVIRHGIIPLLTASMEVLFLRVAPSVAEWVGIGLSIVGVVLTASGRSWLKEDEELYLNIVGNMLAVISAFGLAGLIIMTRYLLKTLPIWTLLFYIKLIGIIVAVPLLFLDPPFTTGMNSDLSYYLVTQGFLYTVGIGIMFHSLTLENASTVALVKNISILVAFALERYVLGIIPTVMELLGAVLVIGSTTVVAIVLWFNKWKEQKSR